MRGLLLLRSLAQLRNFGLIRFNLLTVFRFKNQTRHLLFRFNNSAENSSDTLIDWHRELLLKRGGLRCLLNHQLIFSKFFGDSFVLFFRLCALLRKSDTGFLWPNSLLLLRRMRTLWGEHLWRLGLTECHYVGKLLLLARHFCLSFFLLNHEFCRFLCVLRLRFRLSEKHG